LTVGLPKSPDNNPNVGSHPPVALTWVGSIVAAVPSKTLFPIFKVELSVVFLNPVAPVL
jgi:hypothetical protein